MPFIPNQPNLNRLQELMRNLPFSEEEKATRLRVVLDDVHIAHIKEAFATGGASTGAGAWAPWSARYAAWRKKYARIGSELLRLTSSFFDKATEPEHADHVANYVGGDRWQFGFNDPEGAYHERGNDPLPRRSVMDKTASQKQEFLVAYRNEFIRRVKTLLGSRRG